MLGDGLVVITKCNEMSHGRAMYLTLKGANALLIKIYQSGLFACFLGGHAQQFSGHVSESAFSGITPNGHGESKLGQQ